VLLYVPKRDAAYMQSQRDLLAKAALDCLVEKGAYETSLRDVCKRTGVSIGALYIHFQTREDLILAACSLDQDSYTFKSLPETWQDFENAIVEMCEYLRAPQQLRRFHLSVQFVAELLFADKRPKGLSEYYQIRVEPFRAVLSHLHKKGEIALPLGVDETATAIFNHFLGSRYVLAAKGEARKMDSIAGMLEAMALIAGRKQNGSARAPVRREGGSGRAARN
jgi:AcrR family transcriptional regulator